MLVFDSLTVASRRWMSTRLAGALREALFGCVLVCQVLPGTPGKVEPPVPQEAAWAFVGDWMSTPPFVASARIAGTGAGDVDGDGAADVAVAYTVLDALRIALVSGRDGAVVADVEIGHDLSMAGRSNDGPSIAALLDEAHPERSSLLTGFWHPSTPLIGALDLHTLTVRFRVRGAASDITAGPDWNGDGWRDFAAIYPATFQEEGQLIHSGHVTLRSGTEGAEIERIDEGWHAQLEALTPLSLEEGPGLLVASSIPRHPGQVFKPGTLLTAYALPGGRSVWTAEIACDGVPSVICGPRAATPTANSEFVLGIPYRWRGASDRGWITIPGAVSVVSPRSSKVLRTFDSPACDGFGSELLRITDQTGDGTDELVATCSIGRENEATESSVRLIDGASGELLAHHEVSMSVAVRQATLVATPRAGGELSLVVVVVATDGATTMQALRLERRPSAPLEAR